MSAQRLRSSAVEAVVVVVAALALTCVMTWPLITDLSALGRLWSNDAQWSVWVVSWVARALTSDPLRVFDANIFYPHPRALFLSEPSLVAGALAAPAWVATRNPVLAHNVAFLASFVLSAAATYALAKYLTGNRVAASVAAVIFAFCPYVFAHTAHIHLEMTAGMPLALWAVHRHADRPSVGRGSLIGLAMALQIAACGYYGVLLAMVVPAAMVFLGVSRKLWRSRPYWSGAIAGAIVAALVAVPLFFPYMELRDATGFGRTLEEGQGYSATWESYLTSAAWAHRWWLGRLVPISEVLFPGFFALAFGAAGAWAGWRSRERRETVTCYAMLVLLSFWLSLGPSAGLYAWLHRTVLVFSFLRAPGRFGIAVILGLAVLSALAVDRLSARVPGRWRGAMAVLPLLVAAELFMGPIAFSRMPRVPNSYLALAALPSGPAAEFPFYRQDRNPQFHALYMLFSTYHWQKLVNGYGDIVPADFTATSQALATFPDAEAIATLKSLDVRYLIVNYPRFTPGARQRVEERMRADAEHFRELQRDAGVALYLVSSWPIPEPDRRNGVGAKD